MGMKKHQPEHPSATIYAAISKNKQETANVPNTIAPDNKPVIEADELIGMIRQRLKEKKASSSNTLSPRCASLPLRRLRLRRRWPQ
jgi:hypothetical protein